MKLIVNIVFIMVIIGLSSCTSSEITIDNLEVEKFLYSIDESSLQKDAAVELDDIPTNSVESSIEYGSCPKLLKFVSITPSKLQNVNY